MSYAVKCFYAADGGAGGDGGTADAGGAGEGGTQAHWLDATADFADLAKDKGGKETLSKYKTIKDALKGHVELQKQFRQSFRVPDSLDGLPDAEVSKITDRLKGILKPEHLRRFANVPETPEGYEFEIPEGTPIDEQALKEYRALLHADGVPTETAKKVLAVQLGMVQRLNDHRTRVIQGMADNNYKTFLNEDCGGNKEVADASIKRVIQYMQTQFVKDGVIDTEGWEKFRTRTLHGDRFIELPILRALREAAQMKMGTGGSPNAFGSGGKGGEQIDVKARWPNSAALMQG
jgi:hypothetical protein